MKRNLSPLAVGGFVVGAAALAIAAIMLLWGGRLFTRSQHYVLYFKNDVNGLRAGAAVKFKGVQVGYVDQILLRFGATMSGAQPTLSIPVIISLESGTVVHEGSGFLALDQPAVVKDLVQHGMRGQLATESIVTGILYVSLDMRPNTPIHLLAPPNSTYPEIPTVPTQFEQAQELAMRALSKLGQVDLDGLIAGLTKTVTKTGDLAGSPQLKAAIDSLPATINKLGAAADSIQRLADNANHEITTITDSLRQTTSNATLALQQTQATLKTVRETIGPGSPLDYQLGQTLIDLSEAARSMHSLADYLERNPSSLIRGRAPEDKP
ncbi:MAG: MlaD family protein [Candidatus Binataceae bacterium]